MSDWMAFLEAEPASGRFLGWPEVRQAAGLSRTTAWRLQRAGQFPAPYSLSPGRVGYSEVEIEAWKRWRTQSRGGRPVPRHRCAPSKAAADAADRQTPAIPDPAPAPRAPVPPAAPSPPPRVEAPGPANRRSRARPANPQQTQFEF
jgi:predicted DNA-binding transcriptional regulator AlpA